MSSTALQPVQTAAQIEYPSSDGKPVAESDHQLTPLTYARDGLRHYFRHRPDVYVAGNLLIYYEQGNPRASVAPDVFVVKGVPNHDRFSYLLWEEGKAPDFVMEITSRSTQREDQGRKRALYRRLRVAEYWQYDPTGDYLAPPLRGMALAGGEYAALPERRLADGALAVRSEALGLEVRAGAWGLRFHDAATGRNVLTLAETDAARERAEQARERAERGWRREQETRRAAEARVTELEALLRQAKDARPADPGAAPTA